MRGTVKVFSSRILIILFSLGVYGCAPDSSEPMAIPEPTDWVTLIDGTEGLDNFNRVGDANWTEEFSSIRATEGNGASWLVKKIVTVILLFALSFGPAMTQTAESICVVKIQR